MKKLILLLPLFILACSADNSLEDIDGPTIDGPLLLDTTGASLVKIEHLHDKKNLKDQDKTLVEYVQSNPNRPSDVRNRIYLLPLGYMSTEIEEAISEEIYYLELFFQMEVEMLDRVPFSDMLNEKVKTRSVRNRVYGGKYDKENIPVNVSEQVEAASLLDVYIVPSKPDDAVAILGITDHDMYSDKYNFLWGSSRSADAAGIVSFHRLWGDEEREINNIRKVMSKQIVNLFSIKNGKDYRCLTNFSNDIYELQNKPMYLSPRACEKLKVSIGFHHKDRYLDLHNFWMEQGNQEMVNYYDKCLRALDSQSELEEN